MANEKEKNRLRKKSILTVCLGWCVCVTTTTTLIIVIQPMMRETTEKRNPIKC